MLTPAPVRIGCEWPGQAVLESPPISADLLLKLGGEVRKVAVDTVAHAL